MSSFRKTLSRPLYPVEPFSDAVEICQTMLGCEMCAILSNMNVTTSPSGRDTFSACPKVSIDCPLVSKQTQQLPCVSDVPYDDTCVSDCPNQCSGNGFCDGNLVCQCDFGFSGSDCSTTSNPPPSLMAATQPYLNSSGTGVLPGLRARHHRPT